MLAKAKPPAFMRRVLRRVAAASVCVLYVMCGALGAYADNSVTITNNIASGAVCIAIEEYDIDDSGRRVECEALRHCVPGETIYRETNIINSGEDAWIRVRLERQSDAGIQELPDSMIGLASDKWLKRGDYFYYTEAVNHDQTIPFIKSISIPTTWTEGASKNTFAIISHAEAVQVRNFDPVWGADDPWFGTLIETSVHTRYDGPTATEKQAFRVNFLGGIEGMVAYGDNFFSNWENMMPGDHLKDSMVVKNEYTSAVTVYFSAVTQADDEVLDDLIISIDCNDKFLYTGPLSSFTLKERELGVLMPGESMTLSYELIVPDALTNDFALKEITTRWTLRGELNDASANGGVRTGDESGLYLWGLVSVITLAGICGCAVLYRRKTRKEAEADGKK